MIKNMDRGTGAAKIPRWQSQLQNAFILLVFLTDVWSVDNVTIALSKVRASGATSVTLRADFNDVVNSLSKAELPQLYFDQF